MYLLSLNIIYTVLTIFEWALILGKKVEVKRLTPRQEEFLGRKISLAVECQIISSV